MDTNPPPPPSQPGALVAIPPPVAPPPPPIDSMQALQKAMQEVGAIEALLMPPVQVSPHTQGGAVYIYVRDAARLCNRELDTATYRKLTIDECIQTVRAGFSVVAGVVARQAQLPELVQHAPKITQES